MLEIFTIILSIFGPSAGGHNVSSFFKSNPPTQIEDCGREAQGTHEEQYASRALHQCDVDKK